MVAPVQVSPRGAVGVARWRHRIVAVPESQRNGSQPFSVDVAYWAGLLVHQSVVARIGYPRSEFFRCYGDYEYCLRLRQAGMEIMAVPTSRVAHHEGLHRTVIRLGRPSVRTGYPPARYYYDARNAAFTAWHTMRSPLAVGFQIARQCRLALGDLLYEDQKLRRLRLRMRGTSDGLRGRLGRRQDIE
jgi:GT2 family glycosyltransferase